MYIKSGINVNEYKCCLCDSKITEYIPNIYDWFLWSATSKDTGRERILKYFISF